ncbi:sensor histidine kinase [Desulfospira joergensenii]|uniref:sensor histidine kinase n=1 Tax=Desulfospira joergensenii TaxID=53329 RepID=UPI0003FEB474|nr:hybrid sensor histidine kinase/response regulator [Desulfospira joergensenii]
MEQKRMTAQDLNQILIVDDEEDIRDVLAISLADMGYEVLEAENGEAAMALFREKNPMIVLTDIKMPGMDGIEILKKIKSENPYAQVIMITGHGDTDIAIRSLKHEAIDFITKPISGQALEISLKRAREKIITRRQLNAYTESLEELIREKTMLQDNLANLGVMIGSISHSVKGLLTKLDGALYLIDSALKKEDPDQLADGMDILKQTIDRIKKMIFDILYYSKERELKIESIDLVKFANDVADTCEPKAAPNKVRIERDFEDGAGRFKADPEHMRAALINILDNAVDACIEDRSEKDHSIEFRAAKDKEEIVFEIRDNGIGMDPETREKVFNLFFSSKQNKGTGFGLFITKNIIRQHGGSIHLKSAKGKGTCIHIRVPLCPA